ncbi:hypothetical protein BDR26DRAFT_860427, partial [Obelidium mucronatum]
EDTLLLPQPPPPEDLTEHLLQPLLSQLDSDFELVNSRNYTYNAMDQSTSSFWTTTATTTAAASHSSPPSAIGSDSSVSVSSRFSTKPKSRQTHSSKIWTSISAALRDTEDEIEWTSDEQRIKKEKELNQDLVVQEEEEEEEGVGIGSATLFARADDDSLSERVTAELVDVPIPSTLFASKWSYDWDLSSKPRTPNSVSYRSDASASSGTYPIPFIPTTTTAKPRTHYWPFTDQRALYARRSNHKRRSGSSSKKSQNSTAISKHKFPDTHVQQDASKTSRSYCICYTLFIIFIIALLFTTAVVYIAHTHSYSTSSKPRYPQNVASPFPQTLLNTLLSPLLPLLPTALTAHLPPSLTSPPSFSNFSTTHKHDYASSATTTTTTNTTPKQIASSLDPIFALLDKSSLPLQHLLQDLKQLPRGVTLSLSAHTALSLATVIESLGISSSSSSSTTSTTTSTTTATSFDAKRVCDTLRDLAKSLNRAADGLVIVQSEGFFVGRGVVRIFEGFVREVDGVLGLGGDDHACGGGGGGEGIYNSCGKKCGREQQGGCSDTSGGGGGGGGGGGVVGMLGRWLFGDTKPHEHEFLEEESMERKKRLDRLVGNKLEDALDEMDLLLGQLEVHIFDMIERSSIVHAVWQGANGIAERERRRVVLVVEELKDELESLKQKRNDSGEWVRKLHEWIFLKGTGGGGGGSASEAVEKVTERSLRRLQQDMDMLCQVVQGLHDMAPGIVQVGSRVKEMRAAVQRFRSDLKASTLVFGGGDVSQQVSRMHDVVRRLTTSVGISN